MKLSKFRYKLPPELIALYPTPNRDECRLMVLNRKTGKIEHKIFKEILDYFDENDVRPLGRGARGVKAITVSDGDFVVGAVATLKDETRKVLTITENGLGKRTELSEFSLHNRGGKGMKCHNLNEKTGKLNGIALVNDDDDVMLITNTGTIIRTHVDEISVIGRTASGVRVMRTGEDVLITNFTVVEKSEEQEDSASDNADDEITADLSKNENSAETSLQADDEQDSE